VLGAKNFEGSPIHALLVSKGVKLDLPAVGEDDEEDGHPAPTATPAATPAADALGGIV
jgi:hypothetical protein